LTVCNILHQPCLERPIASCALALPALRLATLAAPQHRPNAIGEYFREGRARSTDGSIGVVGTSRDRNPKAANCGCTAGVTHPTWHGLVRGNMRAHAGRCRVHSKIVGGLSDNIIE